MTRTDVHSPKNLVTEDYEFVGCGNYGTATFDAYSPVGPKGPGAYLIREGWTFAENGSAGGCYHCGAHFVYFAVLKHLPTKTLIKVGETCLDNRFGRATAEFHALRKRAELDRQAQRIVKAREAFAAANPAEYAFLADAHEAYMSGGKYDGFYDSLWSQLSRKGELSAAQVAALAKSMARQAEWKAQDAAKPAEKVCDCPTGKVIVTGTVLSVKTQASAYNRDGVLKMLVKDDSGYKVWCTVPDSLMGRSGGVKGQRVSFKITMTPSDNDATFGIGKRPTQAVFIDDNEEEK